MGNDPLTEEEGKMMGAIMSGFRAMLGSKDGKPIVDETAALMEGVELDCGDGTKVLLEDDEVTRRVEDVLKHLRTERLVEYMFEHPEPHSTPELGEALDEPAHFVSVMLYKLRKLGIVREVTVGNSVELNINDEPTMRMEPVIMHQVDVSEWLKVLRRRKDADDSTTAADPVR